MKVVSTPKSTPKNFVSTQKKVIFLINVDPLVDLGEDDSILNEVLVADDSNIVLDEPRKVREVAAGVKLAVQNVQGNKRKSKGKKAVEARHPASGSSTSLSK